jgi:hypothetical protein
MQRTATWKMDLKYTANVLSFCRVIETVKFGVTCKLSLKQLLGTIKSTDLFRQTHNNLHNHQRRSTATCFGPFLDHPQSNTYLSLYFSDRAS